MPEESTWFIKINLRRNVDDCCGSGRGSKLPSPHACSGDIEEPLTPSHLLLGRRLLSKPEVSEDINVANDAEELTRRSSER